MIQSGEGLLCSEMEAKRQSEPVVSSVMSLRVEVRDRRVKDVKPSGMLKLAQTNPENSDRVLDPRELYVQKGDRSNRDYKPPKASIQQTISEA